MIPNFAHTNAKTAGAKQAHAEQRAPAAPKIRSAALAWNAQKTFTAARKDAIQHAVLASLALLT